MTDSGNVCSVLVVGAGPAGIAAAVAAAQGGGQVIIVDDNPAPGGQIWRGAGNGKLPAAAQSWIAKLNQPSIRITPGSKIVERSAEFKVVAEGPNRDSFEIEFEKLILATGARERFLPFPGWTLPNVMGAGGLQAMVKGGLSIAGKRVVIAGTGPLLLAVAEFLSAKGAQVLSIAEQASRTRLLRFGFGLLTSPQKLRQAITLKRGLAGVRYLDNCWPVRAEGKTAVERLTLVRNGVQQTVDVDYVGCGFGLVPNHELASLFEARITDGAVETNQFQETSIANVFSAGEATGIGGVALSLVEGEIAGYAAAGLTRNAQALFALRESHRRFSRLLDRTFALRGELKQLAKAETIVCRCEDVPLGRLQSYNDWRAARLMTRCGMGPCQARICGPAVDVLFGWNVTSNRPPVFPAQLSTLSGKSRGQAS